MQALAFAEVLRVQGKSIVVEYAVGGPP